MVYDPTLAPYPYIDPGTAVPPLDLGNLSDPGSQRLILLPAAPIPERLAIERQEPAHPSLTEPKALGAPLSRRSLRLGPYQFFALIAFSA
jgi:hypothetical protein